LKHCSACKHRNGEGYCESLKLREGDASRFNEEDELVYSYNEGGGFWVGELFGCVHHIKKDKN
jgi:hypothetical protein